MSDTNEKGATKRPVQTTPNTSPDGSASARNLSSTGDKKLEANLIAAPALRGHAVDAASAFLQVMAPDGNILFVTLPDGGEVGGTKHRYGTWDSLKRILLADNGRPRHGVFWTVNATKGDRRRTEDVIRIRAFFIDLDHAPIDPVLAHPVTPHAVVRTSGGKHHAYWKVADCPLEAFEPIQQELIKKFNADPVCFDAPRIMRLPGTLHNKKEIPVEVELLQINDFPAYKTRDFYEQMDLHCSRAQVDAAHQRINPVAHAFTEQGSENVRGFRIVEQTLESLGMLLKQERNGKREMLCPWAEQHTQDPRRDYGTALLMPAQYTKWSGGFRCMHGACTGRTFKDMTDWLTAKITGEQQ